MALFQVEFYSKTLSRTVQFNAILPHDRQWDGKPLRSLYLLHGYGGSQTEWLLNVPTADLAVRYNLAIFLPAGENTFYLDDNARGAMYSEFLCDELVTFTRNTFPLSTRREDTTICGQSMGGYGALRNGLLRSDVFGNVVALSPALLTDMLPTLTPERKLSAPYSYYVHTFGAPAEVAGSDRDPRALAKAILDEGRPIPRLYFACGTEDMCMIQTRSIHEYLNELGFPHELYAAPGPHEWSFWNGCIDRVLTWVTAEN